MFSGCGVAVFLSWFSTTFMKIMVELMTSGLPQVYLLWLCYAPCKTSSSKNGMAVNYCGRLLA